MRGEDRFIDDGSVMARENGKRKEAARPRKNIGRGRNSRTDTKVHCGPSLTRRGWRAISPVIGRPSSLPTPVVFPPVHLPNIFRDAGKHNIPVPATKEDKALRSDCAMHDGRGGRRAELIAARVSTRRTAHATSRTREQRRDGTNDGGGDVPR